MGYVDLMAYTDFKEKAWEAKEKFAAVSEPLQRGFSGTIPSEPQIRSAGRTPEEQGKQ
jgi:hypothetical protein